MNNGANHQIYKVSRFVIYVELMNDTIIHPINHNIRISQDKTFILNYSIEPDNVQINKLTFFLTSFFVCLKMLSENVVISNWLQ